MAETRVLLRKWAAGSIFDGDILALFPDETADFKGHIQSYMHVGQHGAADLQHCLESSVFATAAEAEGLVLELLSIGYDDLRVITTEEL